MKLLWLQLKIKSKYRTQVDFAEAINKREEWVSRVINGRIKPNKEEKKLMMAALKIDYDPFLEEIHLDKD